MRKIFIGAGHSNVKGKDRGSVGNNYIEGELAVEFRDLLIEALKEIDENVDVHGDPNSNILSESIRFFTKLVHSDSIVIDIHWNAATPSATGTEVLVPHDATSFELQLAHDIARDIAYNLNIPKRGNFKGHAGVKSEEASHHKRLGWMRLPGQNILIEMCFITNIGDMQSYQRNKLKLADTLACTIYHAAKDTTPAKIDSNVYHVVRRGDSLSKIAQKYNTTTQHLMNLNKLTSTTIYIDDKLIVK